MTKEDLLKAIAAHLPPLHRAHVPSLTTLEAVLQAQAAFIVAALQQNQPDVPLYDLGKFTIVSSTAHQGRNLRTGELMTVPAGRRMRFRANKARRDALAVQAQQPQGGAL